MPSLRMHRHRRRQFEELIVTFDLTLVIGLLWAPSFGARSRQRLL